MYNLRYHLVSLVAVFLAFALGLVLGSVVAERGYLDEQQTALVESLQGDFDELRNTNERLQQDYDRAAGFASESADALTAGVLEGQRVLVISNEGRTDGLSSATGAVLGAGGEVVTAVVASPGFGLEDPDVAEALGSVVATSATGPELEDAVVDALALELTTAPEETPVLDALEQADVLSVQGLDEPVAISGAVVLAAFDGEADMGTIALGDRLSDSGVIVVGAETKWRDEGVVASSLEAGLSAVDAIDMPQGAFSAVWILAGRASGFYGVGEGATALFPPVDTAPSE